MALLPSGSSKAKEAYLVSIVTPYFEFYIKGALKIGSIKNLTPEDRALYEVNCEDEAKIEILNVVETEARNFKEYTIPQFFEQTPYQVVLHRTTEAEVKFDHDNLLMRRGISPVSKGNPIQMGVLNFANEIGMTELRILVGGKVYLRLTLEIYPTKMSYKSDYLRIREEVVEEIYNLAFDFMRRTYLGARLKTSAHPSLTEFFSIFKDHFNALYQAIRLIEKEPHHEMVTLEEIRSYREGTCIGPKGMWYLNKHPQQIQGSKGYFVPKKVLHVHKQMTTDLYENQMVKYMMTQILNRLKSVKSQYEKLQRDNDEVVLDFLNGHIHRLEAHIGGNFFKTISKLERVQQFSLVLQMAPAYQKFYKVFLILQKGLSITSDFFHISNKNIAELYEYWCFIKLGSLLKKKHTLLGTDLVQVNAQGLFVNLKKGKQSEMRFKHGITGEMLTLAYNQRLEQGPTAVQKPDNILSLKKEMSHVTYRYVLDAKYKVDDQRSIPGILELPREEDINTMHRYRDAIVCVEQIGQSYERNVFAGIILFPGTASAVYKESRFYQSIEKVNIGALPFLPSQTHLVEQFLEEIIDRIGHSEYDQVPKVSGFSEYMSNLQIEERDVLVGPLRNKEQLEKCLTHNLYHTPCKQIKDYYNRPFKYVALYEHQGMRTLSEGGIRYIGKVVNIQKVQRKALRHLFPTDEPNLEEEYLVYEISNWIMKEKPILPGGQGVRRPNYTNHTLLKYAKTVPELHIKDITEFKLILQLRRISKEVLTDFDAKEQVIFSQGDNHVYLNEKREIVVETPVERKLFTIDEFIRSPRKIYRAFAEN